MRCLLILAHPRRDSLCGALFDAYRAGAHRAGMQCRELVLTHLQFDNDVHVVSPEMQVMEPDLIQAQRDIAWAEHILFVYPTWWGTFPARLKGFLDRVLTPGFAFHHRGDGCWDKLLVGRTVDLITTLDTPPLVYRYVYRAPGQHALARATLGYCGLRTVNVATFGPVVSSTAQQRQAWLAQAYARGARLEQGPLTPVQRQADGLRAWAAGLRLQFYPMTWVAYSMGALINPTGSIARSSYLLGYLVLFLLEAATVFLNDWYDYESDRRNRNASMFSGGSRVLVEERINRQAMRQGIVISLLGTVLALFALLASIPASAATTTLATYAVMSVLALGYTTPPLKLSYRSLGELDVALTHSVGAILTGYVVQGGDWANPLPWLLALPLGIAIFPAILLAGCPDREADAATGKRTLAVVLGKQKAAAVALIATLLAPIAAIGLMIFHPQVADLMTWSVLGGMLHALWLASRLRRFTHVAMPERIDSLLAIALSFILWFCVPPALVLVLR